MTLTRRWYVLGLVPSLAAGCLAGGPDDDPDRDDSAQRVDSSQLDVQFEPDTGGGGVKSRERVILRNVSDEPVGLSGYRLVYESGREFVFSNLTLEPGAEVAVVSRDSSDGVAESDPPTYYRGANFDSLVLADGTETVRLVSPDGTVVLEADYEG